MTTALLDAPERLLDLLADRAVQGLSDEETHELDALLAVHHVDDTAIDLAASAVDLAFCGMPDTSEMMPDAVRRRIETAGVAWLAAQRGLRVTTDGPVVETVRPAPARRPWATRVATGALVAASLLVAVLGWTLRPGPAGTPTVSERLGALLTSADTTIVPWADNDRGIAGDVVWNHAEQTGFLRITGLAANDRTLTQYQLWIFDDARKSYSPSIAVDGGVFDIDAGADTGTSIIEIRAALRVFEPSLFAVTTEPPGGVVAHNPEADADRFKIVLTAPVAAGP